MAFESSITVAIATFFLSIAGISVSANGDYIYLAGVSRGVQVQIGVIDWASFLLLDFFYVFAIWTYVTVRGGEFGMRRYLALSVIALPIIFLANALKIFTQIYFIASSGTLTPSYDASVLASMDAVGFMVMFGTVLLIVVGTCLSVLRWNPAGLGWPSKSIGSKKIP